MIITKQDTQPQIHSRKTKTEVGDFRFFVGNWLPSFLLNDFLMSRKSVVSYHPCCLAPHSGLQSWAAILYFTIVSSASLTIQTPLAICNHWLCENSYHQWPVHLSSAGFLINSDLLLGQTVESVVDALFKRSLTSKLRIKISINSYTYIFHLEQFGIGRRSIFMFLWRKHVSCLNY